MFETIKNLLEGKSNAGLLVIVLVLGGYTLQHNTELDKRLAVKSANISHSEEAQKELMDRIDELEDRLTCIVLAKDDSSKHACIRGK